MTLIWNKFPLIKIRREQDGHTIGNDGYITIFCLNFTQQISYLNDRSEMDTNA
jgi:hypothetical protein